jgi:hypothetical protein
MRIGGPDLDDRYPSDTGDPLRFTKALRKYVYRVLDDPGNDLDALGILMLAITGEDEPNSRSRRWFVWRTGQDLGIPEAILEGELERMRVEVRERQGEEWETVREALRLSYKQGTLYGLSQNLFCLSRCLRFCR